MASGELDLFGQPVKPMPSTVRRMVKAGDEILGNPPDQADFLHLVLCQVGMPRSATKERIFVRENGFVSLRLEAGGLWLKGRWVDQPLPYGPKPRLTMIHVSTEAVKTKSRIVEIGRSQREFLRWLGINQSGGSEGGSTLFKKQIQALAACRLSLGMTSERGKDMTLDAKPFRRFEAWSSPDGDQQAMWPGVLELSQDFFETLNGNAVPLDPRALAALSHSALALDVYSWLAHRLCRITRPSGVKVSWENMRDQFGQEYSNPKDFKKEFIKALRSALAVYPDAGVEDTPGGLLLHPSPPPIPKTMIRGRRSLPDSEK